MYIINTRIPPLAEPAEDETFKRVRLMAWEDLVHKILKKTKKGQLVLAIQCGPGTCAVMKDVTYKLHFRRGSGRTVRVTG